MSTDKKIKFRNGLPTKKEMRLLIDEYFVDSHAPRLSQLYGKFGSHLLWSHSSINLKIEGFIKYLNTFGIETERITPYSHESATTGQLTIKIKK